MSDSNHKNQDAPHDAPASNGGQSSRLSQEELMDMSLLLQSGWRVAVAFLAPAFIGIWVDRNLGTGDIFTVVGVLFGFVLVKVVVYRFVKQKCYVEVSK